MTTIPDIEALARLDGILADAYAIPGGHQMLSEVTETAVDVNILRDVGTEFTPMKQVINDLRELLVARGPDDFGKCVAAIYVSLPGDERLRAWIGAHLAESQALVSEEVFTRERPLYWERRRIGQQELALAGFHALRQARGRDYIAEEITRFRGRLREASRQLQRLNGYKQLHDMLHTIQNRELSQLSRFMLRPALDPDEVREVSELYRHLTGRVLLARASIRNFFDEATGADEEAWLPDLERAIAPLQTGPDKPDALRSVVFDVRGVLRMHLPRLNRLLATAAQAIPFGHLSELLRRAAARAEEENSPLEGPFEDAAAALDSIGARLDRIIAVHGGWQDVDAAVWAMEGAVRTAADPDSRLELMSVWRSLNVRFASLGKIDPIGTETIREVADGLKAALDAPAPAPDPKTLPRAFQDYAGMVRLQFFKVDTALLDECAAVARLEPTLRVLIEGGD